MTPDEMAVAYSSLPPDRQARVLADYAHALTIVARGTYVPGTPDVADPPTLRRLNEVLHRVAGHIRHLLAGDTARCPDDVFVGTILAAGQLDLTGLFEEAMSRSGPPPGVTRRAS